MNWSAILCPIALLSGVIAIAIGTWRKKDFPPKFKPGQTFKDYK